MGLPEKRDLAPRIVKPFPPTYTSTRLRGICVIFDDRERECSERIGCDICLDPGGVGGSDLRVSVIADALLVCIVELAKKPVVRVYIDDDIVMLAPSEADRLYEEDSIRLGAKL